MENQRKIESIERKKERKNSALLSVGGERAKPFGREYGQSRELGKPRKGKEEKKGGRERERERE